MKKLIDPVAWVIAILLYGLLWALGAAFSAILPWFQELWHESPRLGALVLLAFWLSPVPIVAMANHVAHGVLDGADRTRRGKATRGLVPGVESLWAGCFGWCALAFATSTTSLVMLFIDPPPPDGHHVGTLAAVLAWASPQSGVMSAYTFVWLALAGILCTIERAAKARDCSIG